ncbi:MAG TPA: serine--tRNA ligase [Sediminibacterium sp.]|uniref:serine--tRNA ligase n=1 Tax=Sediminibacterium sp. TaxID=1917865 RepID=UPI0008B9FAE0|nr:serine--tRNA ligase [Sediminibacterium sp.]OHC86148.1 MAG: serine--tRNA ligase [Sphingobacteriia bacterium RIFOXYC2_FULL_35_18]OHC89661.1 MAG: serine--tRNA ligase [Sphingobacteriia bacterium RIFOXYD2_FULL_35_12]HLD54458.1 serine--tRNA ligase [Sediminibacterium sp.]
MLQVSVLKAAPERVKQLLAKKHFKQPELVDAIIQTDDERKKVQAAFDDTQAKVNAASKEIGQLMAKGDKEGAENIKQNVANWKQTLEPLKEQMAQLEKELANQLVQLPNLPADMVPEGKTPEENEIVRTGGSMPTLAEGSVPHWDLTTKFNLINFELGNKITGSGFPVYIGKGAKLQRSLIQYFLDFNTAAGYTEYLPPFMVNADSAYATGQLPDKEGQMYHATQDDFYLIPTAEVPVTNVYRDTILKECDFPVKMTAYSPCFRREAGSYGKDVRGLNRLHQFEKVEIIQIVHPNKSYETLDEMVLHVEKLLQSLELPYRILRLCGGDMGFTSAITYDFEVYSAAQDRWLEVSSVSNFESYQANRMKCRFKGADGKTQLVHTLNGSSLALPRIVACLLENNQTPEGINIPAALQSYFGAATI